MKMSRISMRDSFDAAPAQNITSGPRKLENNTFSWADSEGNAYVRLHQTDIIKRTPDGKTILNTRGWKTVTTKDRLNKYLPGYQVFSKAGVWYVGSCSDETSENAPFFDGMILPDDFRPAPEKVSASQKLARDINTFVRLLDKMEKLPLPEDGDCWFCSMFHAEPPSDNRPKDYFGCKLGSGKSLQKDTAHLLEHIQESYLHGSLIVNAMRWAGYQDKSISLFLHGSGSRQSVKSALRRYLRRHLGLPA